MYKYLVLNRNGHIVSELNSNLELHNASLTFEARTVRIVTQQGKRVADVPLDHAVMISPGDSLRVSIDVSTELDLIGHELADDMLSSMSLYLTLFQRLLATCERIQNG